MAQRCLLVEMKQEVFQQSEGPSWKSCIFASEKTKIRPSEFLKVKIRPANSPPPLARFDGSLKGWDLSLLTKSIKFIIIWRIVSRALFITLLFSDLTSHRSCFRAGHPIFHNFYKLIGCLLILNLDLLAWKLSFMVSWRIIFSTVFILFSSSDLTSHGARF